MSIFYGVLQGKVNVFKREDNDDTPHLQIRVVDSNDQAWRVPVNVLSADQSFLVFHRADPLQSYSREDAQQEDRCLRFNN